MQFSATSDSGAPAHALPCSCTLFMWVQERGIINVWAAGNAAANMDGDLVAMPVVTLTTVRGVRGPVPLQASVC
jgi:hypothetical protein